MRGAIPSVSDAPVAALRQGRGPVTTRSWWWKWGDSNSGPPPQALPSKLDCPGWLTCDSLLPVVAAVARYTPRSARRPAPSPQHADREQRDKGEQRGQKGDLQPDGGGGAEAESLVVDSGAATRIATRLTHTTRKKLRTNACIRLTIAHLPSVTAS